MRISADEKSPDYPGPVAAELQVWLNGKPLVQVLEADTETGTVIRTLAPTVVGEDFASETLKGVAEIVGPQGWQAQALVRWRERNLPKTTKDMPSVRLFADVVYRDYLNNWISPEVWGEHQGLTPADAKSLLSTLRSIVETPHTEA